MAPEPRRDFPVPLRVELRLPDGITRTEYAVNISPGGLCLHSSVALPEGSTVWVDFEVPPEGPRVVAEARVVWTSWRGEEPGVGDRLWETGLALLALGHALTEQIRTYAAQPVGRRR